MKQVIMVDLKGFQRHIVMQHIVQTKLILQKSDISTKIDVYGYRRAHRCAFCSSGTLCRGCGAVTYNIEPSIY
jgi:hypothetical protein